MIDQIVEKLDTLNVESRCFVHKVISIDFGTLEIQ